MQIRIRLAAALLVLFVPLSASAQDGVVPPALGNPAPAALERARAEIASAMAILDGADGRNQGEALAAAHRDALDARGAMEQAITSGKGEGTALDTATDRLHRAIDRVSEAARSLRQLNPPVPEASIDAARLHLVEAAADIEAVAGRLKPVDK